MMEVGSYVGNLQKQFSSMVPTAVQGIVENAKIIGADSIDAALDLFTVDPAELNSIPETEPAILSEGEFLDPIRFFQDLAEGLGGPEFLQALMLPITLLQNELSQFAQSMENFNRESFDQAPDLRDMQSEISNQLDLFQQTNFRQLGGMPKRGESFQNTMPLSTDTAGQFFKDQLNNSLPNPSFNTPSYQYESKHQYGGKPAGVNLPAYGSQGKTLAEAELGVKFGEVDVSGKGDWGAGYFKGEMFVGARARVFGDMDWEKRNMYIGFEAEVGARAHYEGAYRTPDAPAGAEFGMAGAAFTGVQARGSAEVSFNENSPRVAIGGEAFQGSKAGLDLGTGLTIDNNRVVGGHYGVEAWNGIGAGINADAGFKDGNFRFDFSGGLALAIGAEVSFGFDIGFGDLFRSTKRIGEDLLNDVGSAAESVGKEVGKAAENAVKETAKAATDVADKAVSAAEDAGKAVGKAISSIF